MRRDKLIIDLPKRGPVIVTAAAWLTWYTAYKPLVIYLTIHEARRWLRKMLQSVA